MPLSAQDLIYLKTADQRFRAHVAVFAAYTPTITAPTVADSVGTPIRPRPILNCTPRYSTVAHSGEVLIYGRDSYNRGGGYVGDANIGFALNGGSGGALVDNGDGTATYTAPASGSGIAQINITVTNSYGSKTGHAFVQYPKTTYDETVAEIATISGSLSQHGWKLTLRARGAVTDFVIGKRVLLHIEDTWGGTTSTFGGYQYPEGVVMGYITDTEYFEDWSGDAWLGVEVHSPWWVLSRAKVGELVWGTAIEGGKLYLSNFAPADAVWHFANEITDLTKHHNVLVWSDKNVIDDFITEESDLATLFEDIMGRSLGIAYSDRYGSILCLPDPDVRADEYWGTPSSTYTLTSDYVMDYSVQQQPYSVRKLLLAAFDSSKMGIYAASENPTAPGDVVSIRGLLCDDNLQLVSWAVQKRAQLNRPWWIEASHPLNHVLDLNNFVNAVFTAPNLSGAPTASGQVYTDSINYRPDIANGGWVGNIRYLKRTEGDGQAETGAVSGWGGTGSYWPGDTSGLDVSSYFGDGNGGWSAPAQGQATWCRIMTFTAGSDGWNIYNPPDLQTASQQWGSLVTPSGFSARYITILDTPNFSSCVASVRRTFPSRVLTGIKAWVSAADLGTDSQYQFYTVTEVSSRSYIKEGDLSLGAGVYEWSGTATATNIVIHVAAIGAANSPAGPTILRSALLAGFGTNPFGGGDNC